MLSCQIEDAGILAQGSAAGDTGVGPGVNSTDEEVAAVQQEPPAPRESDPSTAVTLLLQVCAWVFGFPTVPAESVGPVLA